MEKEGKLRYFCYKDHPLIFNEELDKDYRRPNCNGCRKKISGPNYSCKKCGDFIIHKSCSELPWELKHPLHPEHPLILTHAYFNGSDHKCDGCNREPIWGFSYHCSDCNFSLESTCASLPLTVQAKIHPEHPLTLMRRSLSFTCDANGKEDKCMFFLCAICPFLVHIECISYPLLVKHIRHRHPLHLTNSLKPQLNQSDHRLCPLCVKKVNTNYMVYYCSTCDFVTHLHCATKRNMEGEQWERIESTSMLKFEDSGLDGSIDPLLFVVKKSKLGEDNIEIAVEIKHVSHEHDLKLIDEQLENDEKCDGCMWPISPPFYTCTQCRFSLHKSCVELPSKKSHPLHQHPLILLKESPLVRKYFHCKACGRHYCNGFVYRCDKCNFNLDVQCSLRSDIMNHKGHDQHQLILSSTSNFEKCSCCDLSSSNIFLCASSDDCKFTLDFRCATLPAIVRYRSYEQSFTLCYKSEDDSDDEYYCDICERPRNPKHWFYYCEDLDFPAHPKCILGEYPNIKFGKTFTFDIHEHPLAIVDKGKGENPFAIFLKGKGAHLPCNKCGDSSCWFLGYECVKCNFIIHDYCLER
jgi:hypothetical protein